jgi:8-oxo-dGTP pyrophosphatase MutT (NUDIX family)
MPCRNWTVAISSIFNTKVRLGSAVTSRSHCSGATSIAAPGTGRAVAVDPTKATAAFVPATPAPNAAPLVPPHPAARRVSSGRPIRTRCDGVSQSSPWPQWRQPVVHESDNRKTLTASRHFAQQQTSFPHQSPRHHTMSANVTSESPDERTVELARTSRKRSDKRLPAESLMDESSAIWHPQLTMDLPTGSPVKDPLPDTAEELTTYGWRVPSPKHPRRRPENTLGVPPPYSGPGASAVRRAGGNAAIRDVSNAHVAEDGLLAWFHSTWRADPRPLAADVWVLSADFEHKFVVEHRWRGLVPPGGRVEPRETPRGGAIRELAEETGLELVVADLPALRCGSLIPIGWVSDAQLVLLGDRRPRFTAAVGGGSTRALDRRWLRLAHFPQASRGRNGLVCRTTEQLLIPTAVRPQRDPLPGARHLSELDLAPSAGRLPVEREIEAESTSIFWRLR